MTKRKYSLIVIVLSFCIAFTTAAIATEATYVIGKTYVYKYAKDMGLDQEVWKELKPLGKMDENEKTLVDILSTLEPEYQIVVVSKSDFLKNKHLSPKELKVFLEWSNNPSLINLVPNPREGYVVLANGYDDEDGLKVSCMVAWYKQFRDNGYPHENIFLRLYHPNNEEIIKTQYYKDLERIGQPVSELFPETADEVKINSKDGSLSGFLKTIKNLPSDPNDFVYIMYTGEAGAIGGAQFIDYKTIMDHKMLNKAIASIDYERAVVIQSTCYAAALLKDLDKPKNIGNTFAIASVGEKATSVRDWFVKLAIVYVRNPNMSIKELIDGVNVEPPYDPDKAEYFYFDVEKKECPWINEPLILPMNK